MKRIPEIYGTLGPSCCDSDTLKKMFQNGMTGVRLNLSHTNLDDCKDWLITLRETADSMHIVPDLLVDMRGPELRIGELAKPMQLEIGSFVMLVSDDRPVPAGNCIPCPSILFPYFHEYQLVKLDDGKVLLRILDVQEDSCRCEVLTPGTLVSNKCIKPEYVPDGIPSLTEQDLYNMDRFRKYGVTGIMQPFVRCPEDLIYLKEELLKRGLANIRIFAKIENQAGFDVLPSIVPHCDHIVIARGDLGNDVGLTKLPAYAKKIAVFCKRTKTPFMVVTQMLASMETNPVPTRAEVTDIFNAVLDGASSVMLTGETAVGSYPDQAIHVMSETVLEALRYQMESKFL